MATPLDLLSAIRANDIPSAKNAFSEIVAGKMREAIRNEYRSVAQELFSAKTRRINEASDPDIGKKNKDTSWWKTRDKDCDANPNDIDKGTPHMDCGIKCQE